jgi:hypothetical protein
MLLVAVLATVGMACQKEIHEVNAPVRPAQAVAQATAAGPHAAGMQ